MISILSPQNAISFLRLSKSCLIKSHALINLSKVQPSRNLFKSKNATTFVDIIGVEVEQSKNRFRL